MAMTSGGIEEGVCAILILVINKYYFIFDKTESQKLMVKSVILTKCVMRLLLSGRLIAGYLGSLQIVSNSPAYASDSGAREWSESL